MISVVYFIVALYIGYRFYRAERKRGRWSNGKFFATIAFAALEVFLVYLAMLPRLDSPRFLPTFITCGVIILGNFGWFIPLMRRWKAPGNPPMPPPMPPG